MTEPPISARRAQTRERLIEAAMTVFAERGVAGATVEEVCEAAGFSRGAFYSNFASKDELLLATFRWVADRWMKVAQEVFDKLPSGPVAGDINPVIRDAVSIIFAQGTDEHSVLVRNEVRAVAMRQADLREALHSLEAELHETLAELLSSALARYGLQFTVDPLTAIRWMTAVFDHEVGEAVLRGHKFDEGTISDFAILIRWLITTTP